MKIAVISDIHGNMKALQAVLQDINDNQIEEIYCCGDLAMAGPMPIETVTFIKDSNIHVIQGNTDEMIVKSSGKTNDPYTPPLAMMANSIKWIQDYLPDNLMTYLAELPVQKELEFDGLKVLLVHGSPRKNDEGIYPNTSDEDLRDILEGIDANIIFCGHTHYPLIKIVDGKTVVNVGSVGRPFGGNPRACYAVLDLDNVAEKEFAVEHRYVAYDYKLSAYQLSHAHFEGSEELARLLLKASEN